MSTSKRTEILRAAEEIFSAKGRKATIGEIADKAGVAASVIYHHFANKEDLIFSVVGERLQDALRELIDHLAAIRDPVSKLSKCIWLQLRRHQDYPDYANLLVFECRVNAEFREHKAFAGIKGWSDIIRETLREGVQSGDFSPDLDITLARDAILGFLDIENILSLTRGEPEKAIEDLDDIIDLVLAMIRPYGDRSSEAPRVAERIRIAAENVFAANGFENATITGIAGLAGISEGTIYEYYKNKEDLLFSILDARFDNQIDSLGEMFHITSPIRKLRRFFKFFFIFHATQPLVAQIFLRDGIFNKSFYQSKAYEKHLKYLETIEDILSEGQAIGAIRPDINRRVYRNLFLGAFVHTGLRWQFSGRKSNIDKLSDLNQIVDMLTNFLIV